jgi:triacylglycerol esterase/lipase EstA (alpha/beta hydrolase family)
LRLIVWKIANMTALATYLRTTWQMKQGDWCFPPLDPRIASTQSLTPSFDENKQNLKRRLLIVYVHGFIGSEQSFHSFPFDVHMQLRGKVARTHVVHTKVYPRYKTYNAFNLARDNLSQWLSAHEGPDSDVILVGHSMGGILAQEVVLMVGYLAFFRCDWLADHFFRGRRCQGTVQPANTTYLGRYILMLLSSVHRIV